VIRIVLGFLLAPILPMAPFIILNLMLNRSLQGAGPFLVMGILYAYPVMLVVGVPLYLHARAKGVFTRERTVKAAALTGATLGVIVPMSFITQSGVVPAMGAALLVGLIGAFIGAAVGFAFWQIAGRSAQLDSSRT
jgi:hypothetical protein